MRAHAVILAMAVVLIGSAAGAMHVMGQPLIASSPNAAEGLAPSEGLGRVVATPAPGPLLSARTVTIASPGFSSWALLDTRTGAIAGSANLAATSDTASMSKAWVAADYLRRAAESRRTPNAEIMRQLSTMIRDSDTTNTFKFHVANGNLASIKRMISLCGLTDTKGIPNSWSLTRMSARDAARLGACIGDGRAAGPVWTKWLLGEMRAVRGPGRFGVIEVVPASAAVAIKNGWLLRDDKLWHVACMAVGDGWALGVMVRYAGHLGKDHGAGICRKVAEQLMVG